MIDYLINYLQCLKRLAPMFAAFVGMNNCLNALKKLSALNFGQITEVESGLAGRQIGTRLPEGTPNQPSNLSYLSLSKRLRLTLENSPSTQPVDSNLVTHAFTTFYHGHHLLVA